MLSLTPPPPQRITDLSKNKDNLLTAFDFHLRDYARSMLSTKILDAVQSDRTEVGCCPPRPAAGRTGARSRRLAAARRLAEPQPHQPRPAPAADSLSFCGSLPTAGRGPSSSSSVRCHAHCLEPGGRPRIYPVVPLPGALSKPYYTTNEWEALGGLLHAQRVGFNYEQVYKLLNAAKMDKTRLLETIDELSLGITCREVVRILSLVPLRNRIDLLPTLGGMVLDVENKWIILDHGFKGASTDLRRRVSECIEAIPVRAAAAAASAAALAAAGTATWVEAAGRGIARCTPPPATSHWGGPTLCAVVPAVAAGGHSTVLPRRVPGGRVQLDGLRI